MNKPMVVKIHDVNVDQEYVQWIAESLVEKFKLLKTKKIQNSTRLVEK